MPEVMNYAELVRQAHEAAAGRYARTPSIDPVMAAYQKAAPDLGEGASGRAEPSPADAAFLNYFVSRGRASLVPTLFGHTLEGAKHRLGLQHALPRAPDLTEEQLVETGLPTWLREAPAKREYQMLGTRHY